MDISSHGSSGHKVKIDKEQRHIRNRVKSYLRTGTYRHEVTQEENWKRKLKIVSHLNVDHIMYIMYIILEAKVMVHEAAMSIL